jgi:hypothetical protein
MLRGVTVLNMKIQNRYRMHWYRALSVLAAYLLVYIVFSLFGSYAMVQSGKLRYRSGLSISDLFEYMPYAMWYHEMLLIDGSIVIDKDLGGWLYAPLIRLDRYYWHKTIYILPNESGDVTVPNEGGR